MRYDKILELLRQQCKRGDAWTRLCIIMKDELAKHDPVAANRLFSLHEHRDKIVEELLARQKLADAK